MAGNGSLQHQIVVGIGGYRSPKEIQAMQSALSTDCVCNVVNIFLGKATSSSVRPESRVECALLQIVVQNRKYRRCNPPSAQIASTTSSQAPHGKQAIHCSYLTPASSTGMNQARDCRSIRTKMNEISTSPSFRCLSDYRLFLSSVHERRCTMQAHDKPHDELLLMNRKSKLRRID
jgi:hypothetical protein